MDLTPMLKVPQVAERLGCTSQHVIDLIRSERLPASDIAKPGATRSSFRIDEQDLTRFIAESKFKKPQKPERQRRIAVANPFFVNGKLVRR
ncbi:helix-turn-helix domain-containing protein [Planctomicrobium piriforme]|uniref:Helix-turn-helix domain-containing protein n=1 Tax=Planctomicrobium piriforme TaxID=1576369 RepID=A0A1I3Q0L5_9PLAN|nr:helix-turn-helix domain-containing protein [Planctomicrobium piriforme]SFJ27245.1 Helix-turn-helix domain-containing protein [Planctomicrobium piriforme]